MAAKLTMLEEEWTRTPPAGTRVNFKHPAARSIKVAATLAGHALNAVNGRDIDFVNKAFITTKSGIVANPYNAISSYLALSPAQFTPPVNEWAYAITIAYTIGTHNIQPVFSAYDNSGSGRNIHVAINTDTLVVDIPWKQAVCSAAYSNDEKLHRLMVTRNADVITVYKDGSYLVSGAVSVAQETPSGSFYLNKDAVNAIYGDSYLYGFMAWARGVSAEEARRDFIKQWQIFEPEQIPTGGGSVNATLSVTESNDTVAASATVALSASLAVSESADTLSSAASVQVAATANLTESADTIISSASVVVSGTVANTDAPDTVSASGTVVIGATLAQTESADTAAGSASVSIAASLAVTESADTVTSAANVPLSASLSVTEANDSLASASTVAIAASLSVTESADTVSASANIIDGVNASLTVTESDDTLSASASVPLSASLSYTESADSASGLASVTINATATLTETGDSISGVSVVEITATASLTESADSLSASATLVDGISASLNVSEAADTLAAVANAAISAALASSEAGDELSAQAEIALSAALNSVESGDTVVSSVGISVTCSASLSEDGDTLTATASIISNSNTITAASMVRLAEIWARMELDATKPLVTSATQLTVGTISQDISTGGAVRTGSALVPSIDPDTMIAEVWQRLGLDPDNALTQTNTSIDVGNIHLTVSGSDTLTVQRV